MSPRYDKANPSTSQLSFVRHLSAGDSARCLVRIDQNMVEEFARVCGDTNPIHLRAEFAAETLGSPVLAGATVVHGALLNALVSRVVGTELPGAGTLVVGQQYTFPTVCWSGDQVCVYVCVRQARKIVLADFRVSVPERGDATVMEGSLKLLYRPPTSVS